MEKHKKIALSFMGVFAFIGLTLLAIWLAGFLFVIYNKITGINTNIFLIWWEYWSAYKTEPSIKKQLLICISLSFGACYGAPIIVLVAAFQTKRSLHGDARFANAQEIKNTGLLDEKNGILVGKYKGKYLTFGGQQFVMLAAPTRSGKGVGVVIPNLLNFKDSVVVLDIKQENFYVTSGFREKYGQKIFLFNPFAEDYRTSRYNPLDYVRDEFRVADLKAIADVLYPACGRDAFFDNHANNLFIGLGLYIFETPGMPRTIGEMLRQSSGKTKPFDEYIRELIYKRNFEKKVQMDEQGARRKVYVPKSEDEASLPPLSSQCIDSLNRFLSASDNTRSSILASMQSPLNIWINPIVDASTSHSDFDLREVRQKKMSIYIGITPNHLHGSRILVNLLFSQLINLNTRELPKVGRDKYQCLLIMDEFTSIGRVGIIAQAVAYMAGYNLRLLTIVQSPSQLEAEPPQGYTREGAQTLQTNHAMRILYAPREQKDAEEYSKMLGDETVKGKSTSKQKGKIGKGGGGGSVTISDQRRALLLPQEVKEIGLWKEIITLENVKPILCDKIKYYEDENFKKRLLEAPQVPLLNIDLHIAKTENRIRTLTLTDCEKQLNLEMLVKPVSEIDLSTVDMTDQTQVNAIIDDIFNNLGFVKEEV